MEESILITIKKMIGFDKDYDYFDTDLIVQINSCFSILGDLDLGPEEGFFITGEQQKWSEFIFTPSYLGMIKNYIFIKTKLVFDRPETAYAIQSLTKMAEELEWRLHMESERIKDAERG